LYKWRFLYHFAITGIALPEHFAGNGKAGFINAVQSCGGQFEFVIGFGIVYPFVVILLCNSIATNDKAYPYQQKLPHGTG
jgi:hypothetical protein